jgi:hypothetical protein
MSESYWTWQWALRWIHFRDPDRLNESWWHLAEQPKGANSPIRDTKPASSLMLALQEGRLRAIKEGQFLSRDAWADAPLDLQDRVRFRREDVFRLWPLDAATAPKSGKASIPTQTTRIRGSPLRDSVKHAIQQLWSDRPPLGSLKSITGRVNRWLEERHGGTASPETVRRAIQEINAQQGEHPTLST